jgi:hypothetical protein
VPGVSETASAPSVGTRVLLISTYDLGHQPFGLASPAAWLRAAGHRVHTLDLSRQAPDPALITSAELICFYVPMHTATRLALAAVDEVRRLNPSARICFYGLYGQANADHLYAVGAHAVISGEFEAELVRLADRLEPARPGAVTSTDRLEFLVPDRSSLPPLQDYGRLAIGTARRVVGYTEASRGCRHMCTHCPVAPVYNGRVRVVQRDVVLADIAAQVAQGAEHITFGDPDFFNASAHAVRVVEELHASFPDLTYDVTIKVEHLLKFQRLLPTLVQTGCLLVTSAVESMDDTVLAIFDKGHTRADFVDALQSCRAAGVVLNPTFVAFHPWLTGSQLLDTFELLDRLDMVDCVAPIQLTTRLLVPEGSLLLTRPEMTPVLRAFDAERLVYPWQHPDPGLDLLQLEFETAVATAGREQWSRRETFDRLWVLAGGSPPRRYPGEETEVPQFLEPWFCCSEPVGELVTGWSMPGSSA